MKCPIAYSQKILGGKWKIQIVFNIAVEPQGFNELERKLEGITPSTLSKNLKSLQDDGIIYKEIISTIPPKVCYHLTPAGVKLSDVFIALMKWGSSQIHENNEFEDKIKKYEDI